MNVYWECNIYGIIVPVIYFMLQIQKYCNIEFYVLFGSIKYPVL